MLHPRKRPGGMRAVDAGQLRQSGAHEHRHWPLQQQPLQPILDDQHHPGLHHDHDAGADHDDHDAGADDHDRDAGADDHDRDASADDHDRDASADDHDRDASGDDHDRDTSADDHHREAGSDDHDRDAGADDHDRDAGADDHDRDASADDHDRDASADDHDRDTGADHHDHDAGADHHDHHEHDHHEHDHHDHCGLLRLQPQAERAELHHRHGGGQLRHVEEQHRRLDPEPRLRRPLYRRRGQQRAAAVRHPRHGQLAHQGVRVQRDEPHPRQPDLDRDR